METSDEQVTTIILAAADIEATLFEHCVDQSMRILGKPREEAEIDAHERFRELSGLDLVDWMDRSNEQEYLDDLYAVIKDEDEFDVGYDYFLIFAFIYLGQAHRANALGDINMAWFSVSRASYFAGMTIAFQRSLEHKTVQTLARKAAYARHAENRQISARIAKWYEENKNHFKSLDKAAEAVIRIEPVSFRTARKHVGEAAKKLRSAGKE